MMSKNFTVHNLRQVEELSERVRLSAVQAVDELARTLARDTPLETLSRIKFQQIGFDPLDCHRPLNLIEQVNQTFTYLVTLGAVQELWTLHPSARSFDLCLGTSGGTDISSGADGGIAAEVFAAVSPTNNPKLTKDVAKVSQTEAAHKYVFFSCPGVPNGDYRLSEVHPAVKIVSLELLLA